ncbi:uncharacterized protein [Epargyreus clarus]|uniref:uncharacterized protein isoform X2 n=1 Tax=Epargyreus clarus TaxID=520877 RepID=UPI003C2F1949
MTFKTRWRKRTITFSTCNKMCYKIVLLVFLTLFVISATSSTCEDPCSDDCKKQDPECDKVMLFIVTHTDFRTGEKETKIITSDETKYYVNVNDSLHLNCKVNDKAPEDRKGYYSVSSSIDGIITQQNSKEIPHDISRVTNADNGKVFLCIKMRVKNEMQRHKIIVMVNMTNDGMKGTESPQSGNADDNKEQNTKISNVNPQPDTKPSPEVPWWTWIIIGVVILILCSVIVYLACRGNRPQINLDSNTIDVPRPPPTLQPTYARPADQPDYYAYATLPNVIQDTYSTPFVPTLDEMYAQPMPKTARSKGDKNGYVNITKGRNNKSNPGYSNLQENSNDDEGSDTYTYVATYSKAK